GLRLGIAGSPRRSVGPAAHSRSGPHRHRRESAKRLVLNPLVFVVGFPPGAYQPSRRQALAAFQVSLWSREPKRRRATHVKNARRWLAREKRKRSSLHPSLGFVFTF